MKVLVTWPGYSADAPHAGGLLAGLGVELALAPKVGPRAEAEVIALADGCVAVIASTDPFTRSVFERLPDLAVIARVGVGVDSIDLDAATRHGVVVTAARGRNEETVADHTIALMLAALRNVVLQDRAVREGRWERSVPHIGRDLHGKVVGLIGLGAIGQAVARRLQGFGVRIVASDVVARSEGGVEMTSLDELLRTADVVSVHVPLTDRSRGLIGARELASMKPGAILVNTARGAIVDEASLVNALQIGHLGCAALDVFADEPPRGSALLAMSDRTVVGAHVAGLSVESVEAMERHATDAVISVLEGRTPEGIQNPGVKPSLARAPSLGKTGT